ncbi:DUF7065 domain-containing protein [Sporichthya polymorpha]|uniref:DUF7065 domain-containing protein n=1 Tax=Sporichthya polymorpha TaxID=35751 RepID=UPI000361265F|nr:hypothetical protein [Sporichthya polymorpha]
MTAQDLTRHPLPRGLTERDEGVHTPVDLPGWSENYLTQFYAPAAEIGYFFHQGRAAFDVELWNYFFVAFLPGDRFAVANSFAYGGGLAGPDGCGSFFRCEDPFQRWTKGLRGAVSVVSGEQLRAGPFAEGEHTVLETELAFEAWGPAFDLGKLNNDSWATAHYEQHGSGSGHLTLGAERVEFTGSGLRDHSWGPRDMSRIDRHIWIHGQFPSGRTFELFHLTGVDGRQETHAIVGDRESYAPAEVDVTDLPLLSDATNAAEPYSFTLRTATGAVTVRAEVLQVAPLSLAGPSELLFGMHGADTAHHNLLEAMTRFEWDGEIGHGLTDRTIRLRPLP